MNNDLGKIYEERIPPIKTQNSIKEQEVICEDIVAKLNSIRDNKKIASSSTDYRSNNNSLVFDENSKRQLDLLSGVKKQDYNSSISGGNNLSNTSLINPTSNFDSNDSKTKIDFKKFMNKDPSTLSSKLQSLKSDINRENIKVFYFLI